MIKLVSNNKNPAPDRSTVLAQALRKAARVAVKAEHDLTWHRRLADAEHYRQERDVALARCEQVLHQAKRECIIGPAGVRKLLGIVMDGMTVARWRVDPALHAEMPGHWQQIDAMERALKTAWRASRIKRTLRIAG